MIKRRIIIILILLILFDSSVFALTGDYTGDNENPDGCVKFDDFLIFAQGFNDFNENEIYNEIFDLDNNENVAIDDFFIFAESFGKCEGDSKPVQVSENKKNKNVFEHKQAFLISDRNWQDVLQLVPLTTWTVDKNSEDWKWCNQLPEDYINLEDKGVCAYPTLVFHEEPTFEEIDTSLIVEDLHLFRYTLGTQVDNVVTRQECLSDDLDNVRIVEFNIDKGKLRFGESSKITVILKNCEKGIFKDKFNQNYAYLYFLTSNDYVTVKSPEISLPEQLISGQEITLNFEISFDKTPIENPFDVDSIIYFIQQYNPSKVTIIGETSQNLDNLLTASSESIVTSGKFQFIVPGYGANLKKGQIERIKISDLSGEDIDYLSHWENYDKVVYVENNYELSLLASAYASFISAPLIIQGSELDKEKNVIERDVICVGNVPMEDCGENYNLEGLQGKYIELTNTDKIILVNPDDLNINFQQFFKSDKSSGSIVNLYGGTSLSSSILSSAKHEVIIPVRGKDYNNVDAEFKRKLSDLNINPNGKYLTIISSPYSIPIKKKEGQISEYEISRALDQSEYADFDDDKLPDMFVGRIMGITLSDVSSYILRSIFSQDIGGSNEISVMGSSFSEDVLAVLNAASEFDEAGYNTFSEVSPLFDYFDSSLWINKEFIGYFDHGNSDFSGIRSEDIPLLDNSVVVSDSCSTCSSYDGSSFCSTSIRNGALGFYGSVSISFTGNPAYQDTINKIYHNKLSLGEAFAKSYSEDRHYAMNTFIGDPTLYSSNPYEKPKHYLQEGIDWGAAYKCKANMEITKVYPNPYNPTRPSQENPEENVKATIEYDISYDDDQYCHVTLNMYNVEGQASELGRTVITRTKIEPGHHKIQWDGKDNNGNYFASGIVGYQLSTGGSESNIERGTIIK